MNKFHWVICGLVALLVLGTAGAVWAQTSPGYDNSWHVLGAGGSQGMSSGSHTIHGTTGQFAIGPATGSETSVGSGYWYGVWSTLGRVVAYRTYLPIVMRGAGTR